GQVGSPGWEEPRSGRRATAAGPREGAPSVGGQRPTIPEREARRSLSLPFLVFVVIGSDEKRVRIVSMPRSQWASTHWTWLCAHAWAASRLGVLRPWSFRIDSPLSFRRRAWWTPQMLHTPFRTQRSEFRCDEGRAAVRLEYERGTARSANSFSRT